MSRVAQHRAEVVSQAIVLELGFHPPLAWRVLVQFLVGRAGSRTEKLDGDRYQRTIRLGPHQGWIAAEPCSSDLLRVLVAPTLLPVLPELSARLRRLFDLEANPLIIDDLLARQLRIGELPQLSSGLRVPGAISGFELALRAVLGQQVTVKAASTLFGRFVDTFGASVETPEPPLDRTAPEAAAVACANLQQLIDRGLTSRRAETVGRLARAVADGVVKLDPPVDLAATRAALREIAGIGPWTTEYVAMRALGDRDAFPHADLGLLRAARLDKPAALLALAEAWRPWRAYAAVHLWHALGAGGKNAAERELL